MILYLRFEKGSAYLQIKWRWFFLLLFFFIRLCPVYIIMIITTFNSKGTASSLRDLVYFLHLQKCSIDQYVLQGKSARF